MQRRDSHLVPSSVTPPTPHFFILTCPLAVFDESWEGDRIKGSACPQRNFLEKPRSLKICYLKCKLAWSSWSSWQLSMLFQKNKPLGVPWWCRGLRIWCCHCCGMGSIPILEISACWECSQKKKGGGLFKFPVFGKFSWPPRRLLLRLKTGPPILMVLTSVSVMSSSPHSLWPRPSCTGWTSAWEGGADRECPLWGCSQLTPTWEATWHQAESRCLLESLGLDKMLTSQILILNSCELTGKVLSRPTGLLVIHTFVTGFSPWGLIRVWTWLKAGWELDIESQKEKPGENLPRLRRSSEDRPRPYKCITITSSCQAPTMASSIYFQQGS